MSKQNQELLREAKSLVRILMDSGETHKSISGDIFASSNLSVLFADDERTTKMTNVTLAAIVYRCKEMLNEGSEVKSPVWPELESISHNLTIEAEELRRIARENAHSLVQPGLIDAAKKIQDIADSLTFTE